MSTTRVLSAAAGRSARRPGRSSPASSAPPRMRASSAKRSRSSAMKAPRVRRVPHRAGGDRGHALRSQLLVGVDVLGDRARRRPRSPRPASWPRGVDAAAQPGHGRAPLDLGHLTARRRPRPAAASSWCRCRRPPRAREPSRARNPTASEPAPFRPEAPPRAPARVRIAPRAPRTRHAPRGRAPRAPCRRS